jgi:hypothetical protein
MPVSSGNFVRIYEYLQLLLGKKFKVFGVNKSQRALFKKQKVDINIVDNIVHTLLKDYDYTSVLEMCKKTKVKEPLDLKSAEVKYFLEVCKVDALTKYFTDDARKLDQNKIRLKIKALESLSCYTSNLKKFSEEQNEMIREDTCTKLYKEVAKKCPMIGYVSYRYSSSTQYAIDLANYINLCYGV